MSVSIPSATQIADYCIRYFADHDPCTTPMKDEGNKPAANQCAVRVSCALESSSPGFLNGFSPQNRIHRNCSELPPHVLGAHELGQYLAQICGTTYTNSKHVSISKMPRSYFLGRSGIIWFQQCYKTEKGIWSDHIDFWAGWHCMNEYLGIGAKENEKHTKADLFERSRGPVMLFELKV